MRIIEVRFKNLNSLVGEWSVNFSHSAFVHEGIFAITGPTGAGKTTILDAICLALYGRTPRLSKLTKGNNEVMSQQKGECFAEVTFETQKGRYRCHWSQHRARKKAGGELQAPKHEITDAQSGEVLAIKARSVSEQLEELTGMNFERFTRSMLLAQGEFASFLQATPDQRAPILEQLTGTAIYSDLSIYIHKRYTEEKKKLEIAQATLEMTHLLTEEEEQNYKSELADKQKKEKLQLTQLTEKEAAVAWWKRQAQLEQEKTELVKCEAHLKQKLTESAPEKKRLLRAEQAIELSGNYSSLLIQRQELVQAQFSLEKCQAETQRNRETIEQAREKREKAYGELEKHKELESTLREQCLKVRELDLKLEEKTQHLESVKIELSDLSRLFNKEAAEYKKSTRLLEEKKREYANIQAQLIQVKTHAELLEERTALKSLAEKLQNIPFEEKKAAQEKLALELQKRGSFEKKVEKQQQQIEQEYSALITQIEGKRAELKAILGEKTLSQHYACKAEWIEKKACVVEYTQLVEALEKNRRSTQALEEQIKQRTHDLERVQSDLYAQEKLYEGLEREESLLSTQLGLLKKIQNLEKARLQLEKDSPCPLCGSYTHPFIDEQTPPIPDKTEEQVKELKLQLKALANTLSDLRVKKAELMKEKELFTQDLEQQLKGREQKLSSLDLLSDSAYLKVETIDRELKQLEERLSRAESLATHLQSFEERKEELQKQRQEVERTFLEARHERQKIEQQRQDREKECQQLQDQYEQTFKAIQRICEKYGQPVACTKSLFIALECLEKHCVQYIAYQDQKKQLEQAVALLELENQHKKKSVEEREQHLHQQKKAYTQLAEVCSQLKKERHALFGEKNPTNEEEKVSSLRRQMETNLQSITASVEENSRHHHTLEHQIKELIASIEERQSLLSPKERHFREQLESLGFISEEDYVEAQLPEDKRKNLAEYLRALETEEQELLKKKHTLQVLWEEERAKQPSEHPLHLLEEEITKLKGECVQLQRETGALLQVFKDNEAQKQRQQELLCKAQKQKSEYRRWSQLHELIGSADGKKYRNFAQGLTFESLLGYANHHLQKMTDRYLLVRDTSQALDLMVVDHYQGSIARSVKNLSGGEGFIISLSLALGLSNMASQNIRVDSLFLDEGFGTLDEEALHVALDTLSNLHQSGKLIGVISHIPSLKECITTQIQVLPQTGGVSQLSGPGVRVHL